MTNPTVPAPVPAVPAPQQPPAVEGVWISAATLREGTALCAPHVVRWYGTVAGSAGG